MTREKIQELQDSQAKRALLRSIEFEENKRELEQLRQTSEQFHKMMALVQGIFTNPETRSVESVEDFIEASKHSVRIGGPKYHDWQLENWVEEQLNK